MTNNSIVPKKNRPILGIITSHWLSLAGACIVTSASICWILALPSQLRGHVSNPYIGILLFVILPIVFVGGLLLIPVGIYLSRRKLRMGSAGWTIDRPTSIRRLAIFFAVTTCFNTVIGSQLTYRAIEHMEGVQFCGQTCHVMKPEFTAYQEFNPFACPLRGLPYRSRCRGMGFEQAIGDPAAVGSRDEQPSSAHRVSDGIQSSCSRL